MISVPVFLAGSVLFTAPALLNSEDKAIQGIFVASVDVGKMPYENAFTLLEQKVEEFKNSEISIKTTDGYEIKTTPQQMGISFNIEKTLDNAYKHGRRGSLPKKLAEQTRALFLGIKEPMHIEMDKERFSSFVTNTLSPIHRPAQNFNFKYNPTTKEFEQVEATEGRVVVLEEFFNNVISRSQNMSNKDIVVSQREDIPLLRSKDAFEAKSSAENIIEGGPYMIEALDKKWEVEKDDIASWIGFRPERDNVTQKYILRAFLSIKNIEDYLLQFAPGLQTEPVNARFSLKNEKVEAFSLAKAGQSLNVEKSAELIKENLDKGVFTSVLVFEETLPQITSDSIDNLGINTLIGRGESDFAGSPSSRKHNISVGSDKYQGLLIAPGEEFSFNENLGPVNAATGYLPELVIKQNSTVPEYGGGLCQVSTTLFRAALYSGLKISERYNHSYPVVYYGIPGFDATIYPPNPDLKFINNTPGYILIQHQIVGTKLIFEIYGQDDGRQVTLDGPYTYDRQSNGAVKAWLNQTVLDKNGNTMIDKTFYSNYKSPALYPVNRNPLE